MLTSSFVVLRPKCNYILKNYYKNDKEAIGNVGSTMETGDMQDVLAQLNLSLLSWQDMWCD
jgi:hypothetical protein